MRDKLIAAIVGYLDEIRTDRDLRKVLRYVQLLIENKGGMKKTP